MLPMQLPVVRLGILASLTGMVIALRARDVGAHGVSHRDALFVQSINGPAVGPFMYLGAKHMVTGYDHLMFLVGVIFFLYRFKDVALYVSLFTIGHSITLLAGVLGGIHANAYVIDAIIGLSVVYKAFENVGGFDRLLGFRHDIPDARSRRIGQLHHLRSGTCRGHHALRSQFRTGIV